jgi:hypothetical protein
VQHSLYANFLQIRPKESTNMAKEISISEASKRYNQSTASIRYRIRMKKFPAVKKTIGTSKVPQYRIKVAQLEKFLRDNDLLRKVSVNATTVGTNTAEATPIGRKVFDFVQTHPERFESMTLGEINELIRELES